MVTLLSVRECTLFSADLRTAQLIATAGAALGLSITHERALPEHFPEQGLLLIATDLMPLSIPGREGVLLLDLEVGPSESSGALVGIAGSDREVVTTLANRIGALVGRESSSPLVSITATSGGLGLTTLVALLGLVSARSKQTSLLIGEPDRLMRVLGASGVRVDCGLEPVQPPRVGVLAANVTLTPALLGDARARFDLVIVGSAVESPNHRLLLTANTAVAVEQSAAILENVEERAVQIVIRQMSYGSLSATQVAAALGVRRVIEWPEDRELSLTCDFGDLVKAKRAIERARQIWSELTGGRVERRN